MSKHIDRFEKICGQLAHNNPTKPPTDEQKVDWFLDSVTEKTYDSVHATCTDKLLDGDLSFAKVIKLYTHRCFQRYPQFQLEDLESDSKKTNLVTANAVPTATKMVTTLAIATKGKMMKISPRRKPPTTNPTSISRWTNMR
jgi:hypothetical protein